MPHYAIETGELREQDAKALDQAVLAPCHLRP